MDAAPLGLDVMFNIFFIAQSYLPLLSKRYQYPKGYRYTKGYHPDPCGVENKLRMSTTPACWHQDTNTCNKNLAAVRDSLYVIGGKWKLPIIIALIEGPQRFRELQRSLDGITPKVLSKELKELELNAFVVRTVFDTTPVTVEYRLTGYSLTLRPVLDALRAWGQQHREHIKAQSKASRERENSSARKSPAIRKPAAATLPK